MDVRIGLVYTARELEVELPDDTDVEALQREVERLLTEGGGTLWLTDRKGNRTAIAGSKATFIQIDAGSDKGRIGFG